MFVFKITHPILQDERLADKKTSRSTSDENRSVNRSSDEAVPRMARLIIKYYLRILKVYTTHVMTIAKQLPPIRSAHCAQSMCRKKDANQKADILTRNLQASVSQ